MVSLRRSSATDMLCEDCFEMGTKEGGWNEKDEHAPGGEVIDGPVRPPYTRARRSCP